MKKIELEELLAWNDNDIKQKYCGYVAIIWRPNVWKSTFINTLIGEKIAITSRTPQTTRNKIMGIFNSEDMQIVFVDTPWIHYSEKMMNSEIISKAKSALSDADLVLHFIDTSRDGWEEEKYIKSILDTVKVPIIAVYTKTDLPSKRTIPTGAFSISHEKDWYEELLGEIKNHLAYREAYFPEDFYTQQSLRFRISEIIREKVFIMGKEEIPHSSFVQVESMEDTKKIFKIAAYIYVETESQKYILIWKRWSFVTDVWKSAREDLEDILWKKVFLALRIKVRKNWRKDQDFVKKLLK